MDARGTRALKRGGTKGQALLFGLMVVAMAVLLFIGATSVTMSEPAGVSHSRMIALASTRAAAGVDYGLWAINYDPVVNANLGPGQNWGPLWSYNAGTQTYTFVGQGGLLTTEVDFSDPTDLEIRGIGIEQSKTKTALVTLPKPSGPAPGPFDYAMYASGDRILLTAPPGSPGIYIDGYNSENGEYNYPLNSLPTILRSDAGPFRDTDWELYILEFQKDQAADGIIAYDEVFINGDLEVDSPSASQQGSQNPLTEETPAIAFYEDPYGISILTGTQNQLTTSTPLSFPPPPADPLASALPPPFPIEGWWFGQLGYEEYVLCDVNALYHHQSIEVPDNATLHVGCTPAGSGIYPECGVDTFFDPMIWADSTCTAGTENQTVPISVGEGTGSSFGYTFKVGGVLGTGQVIVHSPAEFHVTPNSGGNSIFISGTGGLQNTVTKSSGAIDPLGVQIYDWSGLPSNNEWKTDVPGHLVFYGPQAKWEIVTSNGEISGALNAHSIFTKQGAAKSTSFKLYWDQALTGFLSGGGGGCNPPTSPCLPSSGSFSLQ